MQSSLVTHVFERCSSSLLLLLLFHYHHHQPSDSNVAFMDLPYSMRPTTLIHIRAYKSSEFIASHYLCITWNNRVLSKQPTPIEFKMRINGFFSLAPFLSFSLFRLIKWRKKNSWIIQLFVQTRQNSFAILQFVVIFNAARSSRVSWINMKYGNSFFLSPFPSISAN